jgi:Cu-Zn family superoxide dismutase
MRLRITLAAICAVLGVAGVTAIVTAKPPARTVADVTLRDAAGTKVGTVSVATTSWSSTDIRARVRGMRPGFHGFHIHAVGACEAPDFMSAKGHLKAEGQSHGAHSGDMPPLLVKGNGTATLRVTTDRFTLADLRDADGSAVMIHAGPDNFANIPPRYAPGGPDQETLDTGDSGARVACGVIRAGDR